MKETPRDTSIGAQMAIALQLMKRKNHQAIEKAGYKITMEQLAVLEALKSKGEMTMSELSKAVWKQNANITRLVDKLEKQNFVLRKPVKGDRRAYMICITKEGETLYKELIPEIIETYKIITSCITKEEEMITLRTLKKIIKFMS